MGDTGDFQAVVLAGGSGSRLYPLTQEIPKALLPIANRPLLSYQLDFLEKAGFQAAIIVTTEGMHDKITSFVNERYHGKLDLSIETVEEDIETAEALKAIAHLLRNDFVVISGDLITEVDLNQMLDMHKTNEAAVTVLLKNAAKEGQSLKLPKDEIGLQDFVGLDEKSNRLMLMASSADLDGILRIRKSVLIRSPQVTLHSTMMDAHLYVFSRWVLDLLNSPDAKHISSIKFELIPHLLKNQFRPSHGLKQDPPSKLGLEMSRCQRGALEGGYTCNAVVIASQDAYCARALTISRFLDMNREIAQGKRQYLPAEPLSQGSFVHPSASLDPKAQIGQECVVGASVKVGTGSSVKKSMLGEHCQIGQNCKIMNSVLMSHVIIEDGVSLTSCVVCPRALIQTGAVLKDCNVGAQTKVDGNAHAKGEILVADE